MFTTAQILALILCIDKHKAFANQTQCGYFHCELLIHILVSGEAGIGKIVACTH